MVFVFRAGTGFFSEKDNIPVLIFIDNGVRLLYLFLCKLPCTRLAKSRELVDDRTVNVLVEPDVALMTVDEVPLYVGDRLEDTKIDVTIALGRVCDPPNNLPSLSIGEPES